VLLRETEKLLETWKHPDPYRAPTAPGGKSDKLEKGLHHAQLADNVSQAVNMRETFLLRSYLVCYTI
jgi:hypothetical protein